jgi:hypothetical protein
LIEVGKVVFVKTTQEPVFVVSVRDTPDEAFPKTVHVRRPVMTDDGIQHQFGDFFLEELESPEQQRDRMRKEFHPGGIINAKDPNEQEELFLEIPKTPSVN